MDLKDVLPASGRIGRQAQTLRGRLRLPPHGRVILFCCGTDHLLEGCYSNFFRFVNEVVKCDFDAVSGLGFSIYYDRPPLESFFNQKRNIWTYSVLDRAGIPSFPMVSWRYQEDIIRLGTWLSMNPRITLVGIDFQDAKGRQAWSYMLSGFRTLARAVPERVHFLVYGVASYQRIYSLAQASSRLHIVSEQPFMKATKGVYPPHVDKDRQLSRRELHAVWQIHQQRQVEAAIDAARNN